MEQKASTGCSRVSFRNQSAVFRLQELTIIVGSSVINELQHLTVAVELLKASVLANKKTLLELLEWLFVFTIFFNTL